jgi:hypothetical protein
MKKGIDIMQSNAIMVKASGSTSLNIRKSTLEWVGLTLLLVFSFINDITLLFFMLLILLLLFQKEIGAIKILNILTLRSIVNPGVAVSIAQFENLKWIILFGCSFYLLTFYFKLVKKQKHKIKNIILIVALFTIYNIFTALIYSSLPIVAISKLLSYVVIFLAIIIGIGYTYSKIDWIKWMFIMFQLLMVVSVFLVSTPVGYLRNGRGFQGMINHPNLFAIVCVLFFAVTIAYNLSRGSYSKIYTLFVVTITFYMVIISQSRTAFVSILIILLIYFIFAKTNRIIRVVRVCTLSIFITLVLFIENRLSLIVINFLYKGQVRGNLLYSRENQIDGLMQNFFSNPWFGTGFAVPVLPIRSFDFSSAFVVEPGNLFLAVLSYSGIVGFIIFSTYIIKIFLVNKVNFSRVGYLPISTLLISMGEMTFFSSNNIGIWCYTFLAIYIWTNAFPENERQTC